MKRAIITGATGAIGTALINELINNGVEVLAFTRRNSERNDNIVKNKLVKIKYCALDELHEAVAPFLHGARGESIRHKGRN